MKRDKIISETHFERFGGEPDLCIHRLLKVAGKRGEERIRSHLPSEVAASWDFDMAGSCTRKSITRAATHIEWIVLASALSCGKDERTFPILAKHMHSS